MKDLLLGVATADGLLFAMMAGIWIAKNIRQ